MRKRTLYVLAVILLMGGVAWAGVTLEAYRSLSTAPTQQIVGATGADSLVATTVIPGRAQDTKANPTIYVQVDLSNATGDTVVVECLLYKGTTFLGHFSSTATAGVLTDAAGDFIAPLLIFDSGAADRYEIRHRAPSAGNVDITFWTGAADPE